VYGHALQKQDNDWVKKCMEYEVEGARPRGTRPKKTLTEIYYDRCEWVNVSSGTGSPRSLHSTPLTGQAIKPQRQGQVGRPIAQP